MKKVATKLGEMSSRELIEGYKVCCKGIFDGEVILRDTKIEENKNLVSGFLRVLEMQREEYEKVMEVRGIDFKKIKEEVLQNVEFYFSRS